MKIYYELMEQYVLHFLALGYHLEESNLFSKQNYHHRDPMEHLKLILIHNLNY